MHSDVIANDLELQRIFLKTMSLKHAFWQCLKRFVTAENLLKSMSLTNAFWRYLKRFRTTEKIWKQCLLSMPSDGIWNYLELQKKTTVNGAFWRYLKGFDTFMSIPVGAHPSPPMAFIFIACLDILFVWLSRKSCRPGPTKPLRQWFYLYIYWVCNFRFKLTRPCNSGRDCSCYSNMCATCSCFKWFWWKNKTYKFTELCSLCYCFHKAFPYIVDIARLLALHL